MRLPLGQLFIIGFPGKTLDARARSLLRDEGAGGAILFSRNIESLEQVVALNGEIVAATQHGDPAIISVDQEGGRVQRLRGIMTDVPPMRAVGLHAAHDPTIAQRLGAMMGRELAALGFHWNFAPVVDVDTNPNNPVIGERSFARDAAIVAELAAQYIAGLQGSGVAGSAKHFPGHGDTDVDSHYALPNLPHTLERLLQVELVPFARAVKADVATVMTAHVMFKALDENAPATLSHAILTGLLRERLGYQGVVVSDDLEMAAVADRYTIRELVKQGLNAGVDCFLICHDADKQAAAIEAAHQLVDSGEVSAARAEEAIVRMAKLKQRYVGAPAAPDLSQARVIVRSAPHLALVEQLHDANARLASTSARQQSPVDVS